MGFRPSLLVFAAIPVPVQALPAPFLLERAKLIDRDMKKWQKSKRAGRLRSCQTQERPKEDRTFGSAEKCAVEQPSTSKPNCAKTMEGTLKFVNIERKIVTMNLDRGPRMF